MPSSLGRFVCIASLMALVVGCGSQGPRVAEVTGTVTHEGKPVEKLFLNFVPENGRPSWGVTDEAGHYSLHYERDRSGAVVGTHKVWVQVRPASPKEESRPATLRPEMQQILSKYGKKETSPLRVEVNEDHQVIDLKLD
ncbi:hypothetical protein AYO40_04790 [Planctomycetaceae bacterium SCGC AG-212-D15]|nr:hypothetical protein AYO40_04790 [Planctomycetaceae bacterium SCGC AG-212-D15]